MWLKKLIFLVFIIFGALSLFLAFKPQETYVKGVQTESKSEKNEAEASPSPSLKSGVVPTVTALPSPVSSATTQSPTPTPTPQPSAPVQSSYSVNVSVDNSNFIVNLTEESNQCDVLSKALEQGKISQLNMRYDSNYGTYAVYQINGIGKESSVWWVYKINGQSPSQGCSYIKANSGDNIEWNYTGS